MKKIKHQVSRRDFLVQGAATARLLAAGTALGQGQTKSKVLHIIGHSHIDAAWLWPWRDGADSVLDTFRSALNRTLDRRAEEVQTPAEHVFDSAHPGKLPWQRSFLEVMPANIQVLALKRAEIKEDCTVIRLQERSGISTEASIKSAPLGLDTKLTLRPWELKTLLVKPAPGRKTEVSEVSLIET